MPKREESIATIRIERPGRPLDAWVIRFRRGNQAFDLADRDLRWAIEAWRNARRAGKFK